MSRPRRYTGSTIKEVEKFVEAHKVSYASACRHLGFPYSSFIRAKIRQELENKSELNTIKQNERTHPSPHHPHNRTPTSM